MSVINRMLRDLDQRQQHPQNNAGPAAIAPSPTRPFLLAIWLVIAVVLAGMVFYFAWQSPDTEPTSQAPQQRQAAEPVNPQQLAPVAAEPKQQPAQQSASTTESQASAPVIAEIPAVAESEPASLESTEPEPSAEQRQPAEQQPAATSNRQPQAQQAQRETTPSSSGSADSSMSVRRVQLSPAQLAARNLEKAEEAFSKGQQTQGQELLEQALAVQPLNTVVRERLAAYWYGRGYGNRALAILQQGIQLQPGADDLKLLLARMYERLEMPADALEILKGMTLTPERSRDGLSIRAELAWKAADYAQAVTDYQALTRAQPGNARWWLGLALALDDSEASTAAVEAYRRALAIGGFTAATSLYIRERLAQLQDDEAGGY